MGKSKKKTLNENKDKRDKSNKKENRNRENENEKKLYDSSTGNVYKLRDLKIKESIKDKGRAGKRSRQISDNTRGKYIGYTSKKNNSGISIDGTLKQVILSLKGNRKKEFSVKSSDLRYKVRVKSSKTLILFIVDASGSMKVKKRIEETKGAIMSFLEDAYVKRDVVSLITFREDEAKIILPVTDNLQLAKERMSNIKVGGKTPIKKGLILGFNLIQKKSLNMDTLVVLISDGKNSAKDKKNPLKDLQEICDRFRRKSIKSLVIDIEKDSLFEFGFAKKISEMMGAKYYRMQDLSKEKIVQSVKAHKKGGENVF